MLTIEKVLILKTVEIFAGLADAQVAGLGSTTEEVELEAGSPLFLKGDLGRSRYVIVRGKVHVFDGQRSITVLSDREVFGELAALDPEPRAASATALDEVVLLRLDHEPLYELMTDTSRW